MLLRARLAPLLGLTLLLVVGGMAVIALSAGMVVVLATALGPAAGAAGALLALGVFVGALVVYVRIAVAAPALVLEGVGPIVALRRSWVLVQGSWWRVLGVLLLSGLITSLLTAVVSVPVGVAVSALAGFEPSLLASAIASGITGVDRRDRDVAVHRGGHRAVVRGPADAARTSGPPPGRRGRPCRSGRPIRWRLTASREQPRTDVRGRTAGCGAGVCRRLTLRHTPDR